MGVGVFVAVVMPMLVFVPRMFMGMGVAVFVMMIVIMQVDVELHAFDGALRFAGGVEVVFAFEAEFLQFSFERLKIDAEIKHGANEHVAADSAENVEIESFHFLSAARALIWAAA